MSDGFGVGTVALVDAVVKAGEVSLVLCIGLKDVGCLKSMHTIAVEDGDLIDEYEGMGTMLLIVGPYGYEQKVENLHVLRLECPEQMEPAEG